MTKAETLHLYLEAITEYGIVKLVCCGKVIERVQQPLLSYGISANCRIMVENIDIEELSSESDEDELEDTVDDSRNILQIDDVIYLEERRATINQGLLPPVEIRVARENIIEDVIGQYRANPDLVHHRLTVVFEEEEAALDLEGVTREMFSCFFIAVFAKFFQGHSYKIPSMNPRVLFSGFFEIIGRILSHAFVLCDYLPSTISPIILIMAGTGVCSDELVLSSFLSFIPENDRILATNVLESIDNFDQMQDQLINFFSHYGGMDFPTKCSFKTDVIQIARTNLIAIPLYPISCLKKGLDCYSLLWKGVSENLVVRLMEKHAATSQKVVSLINYNFSEDPSLTFLEERIKGYLERFIHQLSRQQLSNFLRFWTSSDTICVNNLNVISNSTQGINRRPIANTCSSTLHISRRYISIDDFCEEFSIYLSDSSTLRFDSI